MRDTFIQVHRRGGYFRVLGYGFLVLVAAPDRPPTYNLRHQGHHVGRVWFKVLRPLPRFDEGCAWCAGVWQISHLYLHRTERGLKERLELHAEYHILAAELDEAAAENRRMRAGAEKLADAFRAAHIDGSEGT